MIQCDDQGRVKAIPVSDSVSLKGSVALPEGRIR